MKSRLLTRLDGYFTSRSWPIIPFQPILYGFIFGAAVRLWVDPSPPPAFDDVIVHGFYAAWLVMGIFGPVLSLLAWLMVTIGSGRLRFIGMWARLSADISVGTVLMTYHLVIVHNVLGGPVSESKIFACYMVGATLLFTVFLVIRDVWVLAATEREAGRIHRDE